MNENDFGNLENVSEPTFLDLLPRKEIEIDDQKYVCYYEESAKTTDRCFGYAKSETPADVEIFQITYSEKNHSIPYLNDIDMTDDDIVKALLVEGKNIVEKSSQDISKMSLLMSKIKIGEREFNMSYQSSNQAILGKTMYEMYSKRVYDRQYNSVKV